MSTKKNQSYRPSSHDFYHEDFTENTEKKKSSFGITLFKWALGILGAIIVPIVIFFFVIVLLFTLFMPEEDLVTDANVAVIPIKGTIVGDKQSAFGMSETISHETVRLIKKADEDSNIRVILLDINSPGGTAVASAEIAAAVRDAQKPTIAVIRELGASGAFWIATSADTVFSHPLSVVGSIGVVSSYLEFSGTLERYNVTYQRLVAGEYKDAGSPLKKMTPKERELFLQTINKIHDVFINEVALNRGLSREQVAAEADGFIMLGDEAKQKGFVDELGTTEDAMRYIERTYNLTASRKVYKSASSFFDTLAGIFNEQFYFVGRGVGDSVSTVEQEYVPMT